MQRGGNTRLLTPGFKVALTHCAIPQAAKGGDGAVERRLGRVHIGFVDREICPQNRKCDPHEFFVFQHRSGGAVQATQFRQKISFWQGMDGQTSMRELRRTTSRDKEANRLHTILSAKLPGEFKAHQCSQAVAEEGKRLVQEWQEGLSEGLDKRRELSERRLHQPSSPSGELNRTDLNIRWQAVQPSAKNQGTTSRVREAEQTEAGLWARLAACNPRVKGGCGGHLAIFCFPASPAAFSD